MLEKAGAFGCLPIPVLDVISSVNIIVVMEGTVGDTLLFLICIQAGRTLGYGLNQTLGLHDIEGRQAFAHRTIHAAVQ